MKLTGHPEEKSLLHIILVEDNPEDVSLLETILDKHGVARKIEVVSEPDAFRKALAVPKIDLILSDFSMPSFDGLSALEIAREVRAEVPFIFLSGTIGEAIATQALTMGATGYLPKEEIRRLPTVIERTLNRAESFRLRKSNDAALRDSEERFRMLLESVIDYAIFMLDPSGKIISWNTGAQRIKGYRADEIIGQHFRIFYPLEDAESGKPDKDLMVALVEGRFEEEGWQMRKDGNRFWANLIITPVRDERGDLRGYCKVTRDLSERKRAEELLRESTMRLARAETFSHIMVTHIAINGRWIKTPPLLCTILGYTEAELHALSIQDISDPRDARIDWNQYELLTKSELKSFSSDKRFRCKTGEIVWMNVSTTLVLDREGQPLHFLTYLRDITENVSAHEKLRAQASLLDLTRNAIWTCDLGGQILYWNKGAEQSYGWNKNEAVGKDAGILLYQNIPAGFKDCLDQTLATGQWSGELLRIGKTGQELVMHSLWSLMRDDAGLPQAFLVVESDITEKKRMEAESLRHQRVETIGALAGGIAHDLNNALAPVLIGTNLLAEENLSPESRRVLELMRKSSLHGAQMVNQILLFSRGIGGEQKVVNLKSLLEDVLGLIRRTFPASIELQSSIAEDLQTVNGNATQLHQVMLNLCVNARDAMPKGGLLKIEAANEVVAADHLPEGSGLKPGNYIHIAISDTGCGIPAEVLTRIFEPFFTTKAQGRGTGLGLSTSLGIVKTHRGFIQVSSQEGRQSVFNVYLPTES